MNVRKSIPLKSMLILVSIMMVCTLIVPVSAQDTIRPEIYGWGILGHIGESPTFTVWANVTDNDSGVENVTVNIRQDGGSPVVTLMSFNTTFYTLTLPHVELNHTYTVWIESYDVAGNVATSYSRNFDLRIDTVTNLDPIVTLPYVVSVSILTLVVVLWLSNEYNKRNPRPETSDEQEEMEELTEGD
ncbi:MAG: hypothetical protein ACFFF4_13025 [Candidatus Thorarchaeota archaeon]